MTYGDTHYGKWIRSIEVTGSFYATGSFVGAAGIYIPYIPMVGTSSMASSGSITLTGGGDPMLIEALSSAEIYPLSIQEVSCSVGFVYVLYKNPIAHF